MVQFPMIFTPKTPVEFGGNTFRCLTFTRPAGLAEVFVADIIEDPIAKMSAVYASMAAVPVEVITRMSVEDQSRLADAVVPILALPEA